MERVLVAFGAALALFVVIVGGLLAARPTLEFDGHGPVMDGERFAAAAFWLDGPLLSLYVWSEGDDPGEAAGQTDFRLPSAAGGPAADGTDAGASDADGDEPTDSDTDEREGSRTDFRLPSVAADEDDAEAAEADGDASDADGA